MLSGINDGNKISRIARKFITLIILFSASITLVTTGLQLFVDYRHDKQKIEEKIEEIRSTQLETLRYSIWNVDEETLKLLLNTMLKIEGIEYLKITSDQKSAWEMGQVISRNIISETIPIYHTADEEMLIGELQVVAGLDPIHRNLLNRALIILASNAVKTFLVAIFALFVFQSLVSRHLHRITLYLSKMRIDNYETELLLKGKKSLPKSPDEIDLITTAINSMRLEQKKLVDGLRAEVLIRGQTEDLLQESDERLRLSTELANVAVWEYDFATNTMSRSKNHDQLYGLEWQTKWDLSTFSNATHPEDREVSNSIIQKSVAVNGPDQYTFDFRVVSPDDSIRWLMVVGQVVQRNSEGQGSIVRGCLVDITERKMIEDKLLESETKYRHLYETLTQGAVIQDADGRIIDANPAACQILGLSMDQILGKTAYDPRWRATHKDGSLYDPSEMPSNIVIRTGKPVINAYIGIHRPEKDDYTWNLISSVPRFNAGDTKPSFTVTVFTDITTLHLAESRLVESEKRYRSLFENMAAGFVLFEVVEDDNGAPVDLVIVAANKGFEIATGLKIQDVKGNRLTRVLPGIENDAADWIGVYGTVALNGTSQQFEQGSELLGYHYSVIAYQAGPKQCAVTFSDITEQKKVAMEREKLQVQLQQAQKMEAIGNLAGGVAHDYNNMLSVILGYTELALESTELPSNVHDDLEEVLRAARRSTDVTRQLLAFARKQTIDPRVLNLNDTIEEMLKMIRRLIGEDIDLAWLPDGDLWSVNIDPSQIDQILVNLCVNARDAIADVGKLTIETENISLSKNYCSEHYGFIPGNFALLAVSDDGCGMTKETIDKIFEPFFTTKLLGQGTGMGLSTVFGIVSQNGGFINVYSELGEGTTFKIYLPRHEGEPEESGTQGSMQNQLARGETVLVVEDEDSILQLCKRILAELGYSVLTANTPEEAINLAKTHEKEIHLLVTDVVMPMMNGRVLTEHVKSIYPAIKTLFMSGYTANVIAHHGVLEKGIHFVPKPLSRQVLAAKVREALEE